MADPFSVEPPQWFQRLAQPSNALNALGSMAGRYIGAAGSAATGTGDEQVDRKPYYQRFRTNLANTYKQDADPMWRLKEERFKTEAAQVAMNFQNFRTKSEVTQRKAAQDIQAQREILDLQAEAQRNGDGPNGVLNTMYRGNNPTVLNFWNNAQLMASRQLTAMRVNSDKTHWNRLIDSLDIEDRATAMSMPRDEVTGLPADETAQFIKQAAARKQARLTAADKAKNDQAFKNLPLGAQIYERLKRYEEEGDEFGVKIMTDELNRRNSAATSAFDKSIFNDAMARRRKAKANMQDYKVNILSKGERRDDILGPIQKELEETDAIINKMLLQQKSAETPAASNPEDPLGLFK